MLNGQIIPLGEPIYDKITKKVNLDDIELSDETFRISSDNSIYYNKIIHSDNYLSPLATSINSIGLMHPPLLQKIAANDLKIVGDNTKERYRVVCGFRRVHAIHLNKIKETVLHVTCCDDKQCALFAITDNSFQRQLNIMEQVRGVQLLRRFFSVEEISAKSLAIFNSTMSTALINMLNGVANMPVSVHTIIQNDRLGINSAMKLKQYGYDDGSIESFVRLFSKIKTSLSKQKEIITHIHEIAARESISVVDVIESDEIKKIIYNNENDIAPNFKGNYQNLKGNGEQLKDSDENRKGNLVRSILFARRYPNLSKAKEEFAMNLKRLNLKTNTKEAVKLEPPVDFEGQDYTVSFKFSTVEEFAEKVAILSAASKNSLMEQVLQVKRLC